MVIMMSNLVSALTHMSNETTSIINVTGNSGVDYQTLRFNAVANKAYLVLWYGEGQLNSTGSQQRVYFQHNATGTMRNVGIYRERPGVINHFQSYFYADVVNVSTNRMVYVKMGFDCGAAGVYCNMSKGKIVIIEVNSSIQQRYQFAEVANINNAWNSEANDSYTIDISETGTYLLIGVAKVESDSTTSSVAVRMQLNGGSEFIPKLQGGEGTWSYVRFEDRNVATEPGIEIIALRNFTAGGNVSFQIADIDATASSDWEFVNFIVVKVDNWIYKNSSSADNSTVAGTSQTLGAHLSITNKSQNYLILGGGSYRIDAAADREVRLNFNGTKEDFREFLAKDSNDYISNVFMDVYNGTDFTYNITHNRQDASGTSYMKNPELFILALDGWSDDVASDSCTYGGSGDWTITDDCTITTSNNVGGNDVFFNCPSSVTITGSIFNSVFKRSTGNCKVRVTGSGILR